jgi:hypothetical protein
MNHKNKKLDSDKEPEKIYHCKIVPGWMLGPDGHVWARCALLPMAVGEYTPTADAVEKWLQDEQL